MKFIIDNNVNNYECEVIIKNNLVDEKILVTEVKGKLTLTVELDSDNINAKKCSNIIENIVEILNKHQVNSVIIPLIEVKNRTSNWFLQYTARVIANANYQVQKITLERNKVNTLKTIAFNADKGQNYLDKGLAIAGGIGLARTLADLPSNICTPSYLAQSAQELAVKFNLECEILEQADMEQLEMHSLLSVAKGSFEKPKLISLSYKGAGEVKPYVLIGKGVTFDSGGISLKPSAAMDEMKYDMSGGSCVLGVMHTIAKLQAKINLTVVIPAVENMPAHNASKPGDVVKSMSGKTIEILNTDAEGRLILCDALTYVKKFNPQAVIDVATLTGAVIVALGKHHSGMMTNNKELAKDLIQAGKIAQDTVWQLPLDTEFDELLNSNFADMANIGGREAGSVTAGCFLARFATDYSWAHLDIAGTAWINGKHKSSTGRPVALLSEYLLSKES